MIHKADRNYLLYHMCIFDVYYINVHSHTYSKSKGTENDLNKQIFRAATHIKHAAPPRAASSTIFFLHVTPLFYISLPLLLQHRVQGLRAAG